MGEEGVTDFVEGLTGFVSLEKGLLKFVFHLKKGCYSLFCSLKFKIFLKDVIFYVKQLKFSSLTF